MKINKKKTIIIASVLTGVLLLSGVGVRAMVEKNKEAKYQGELNYAKSAISMSQGNLNQMKIGLESIENSEGFIVDSYDFERVREFLDEMVEDDASEYDLKEGDLEEELEVLKTTKNTVEKLLEEMENKVKLEEDVNSLFPDKAIDGVDVRALGVNKGVKEVEITTLMNKVGNHNRWDVEVRGVLEYALEQVKHNETVAIKLDNLIKAKEPKRKDYNEVVELVADVRNEEIKSEFETKLEVALSAVEKEEKRIADELMRQQRESEAQWEAEAKAKEFTSKQTQSNNTGANGVVNKGTTNNQTNTSVQKSQNVQTKPSTNNQTTASKNNTQTTAPKKSTQTSTSKPSTQKPSTTTKPSTNNQASKPSTQPSKPSKPTQSKPSNGDGYLGSIEEGDTWFDAYEASKEDLEAIFGK